MKYKTSFFNMAIVKEDLKRLWGLAALYFISIFFTGPFGIMIRIGDPNRSIYDMAKNFLGFKYTEYQIIFSLGFAILLSMLIYRYLHSINSTTVLHSFPITRKELYNSHNLGGLLLMVIPVIINTLILIGLMIINNDGSKVYLEIFTMSAILKWTGKTLLMNIVIYLVATLTAMITGITLVHGILAFILLFLPLGLGSLVLVNLDQLLYGFAPNNSVIENFLGKIIPILPIAEGNELGIGLILWYILLSIVLCVLALFYYKNRNLERATDPITVDGLKPLFKYGVTFCGMVLGGAYFYFLERAEIWLYFGYVLGGYLGYIIAEMLIQKTIWVFKNIKGLLIYAAIILVVFVGINLDITGFEKRIPDIDKVETAYYGYGVYSFRSDKQEGLEELGNIELVRELHGQMIESKEEFGNIEYNRNTSTIGIAYELKSGKRIYREYTVPDDFVKTNPYIEKIFESEEYKIKYNNIFTTNLEKIDYIEITPNYGYSLNRDVKIIDENEIREVVEVLKEDNLLETFEEFNSDIASWANIRLRSTETTEEENKDIHASWEKYNDNLSQWLKDNGYYERARIMPEDLDYMVVQKIDESLTRGREYYSIQLEEVGLEDHKVEVRDKDKIEYLLNNYEYHRITEGKYLLGGYLNNGSDFLGVISEESLPEDIKNSLN